VPYIHNKQNVRCVTAGRRFESGVIHDVTRKGRERFGRPIMLTAYSVSFEHGSFRGPEQCSLAWMLMNFLFHSRYYVLWAADLNNIKFGSHLTQNPMSIHYGLISAHEFPGNYRSLLRRKSVPVTDRGSPQGYETSRLQHFLENRLTDCGEAVSLMRRPLFTSRKIPGTHFC
jgi:hypothetical protein